MVGFAFARCIPFSRFTALSVASNTVTAPATPASRKAVFAARRASASGCLIEARQPGAARITEISTFSADPLRSPAEAPLRRPWPGRLLPGYLGDVALALGVVQREARGAGRRVAAHFAHLVAHGALHLAGHDHLQAGEARRMERAEARVMRRLGLPNPWRGAT